MRFLVAGAGAMGSMLGGLLAEAGHSVTLADIDRRHLDAVRERGLRMRISPREERCVHVPTCRLPDERPGLADAILVMCKTWANADLAPLLIPALHSETVIVSLQNGLGAADSLSSALPIGRIFPGTTTAGAHKPQPGVVDLSPITASGASISQLAKPHDSSGFHPNIKNFMEALTSAGLPCQMPNDAQAVIWKKVALAATAGPTTALLRCTVAEMVSSSEAMNLWNSLFDEVIEVAHALGVELDRTQLRKHAFETYAAVGHHHTSMADDVANGRRTEIDAFCGEIARLANLVGVAAPTHQIFRDVISAIDEVGRTNDEHH